MKEIRSIEQTELRVSPQSRKIEGYALLFNVESNDLGGFKEVILSQSLDGVIEQSDVLALYNHEENSVLARSTGGKGTLSLIKDEKGLKYSFEAPKTPLGESVLESIRLGDLRNSSFAFTVNKEGQSWEKRDNIFIRTIKQFDRLFDVSPVFRPAYSDTSVAVRSLDEAKKEFEQMEERITVEVEVKVDEETDLIPVDEPTEDSLPTTTPAPEEDMIDIVYNEHIYSIPKYLVKNYLEEGDNKRKLNEYFNDLEKSIIQLKK